MKKFLVDFFDIPSAITICIIKKMETLMSEKLEKLVKIILPDLLNYLEMVEIIERRLKEKRYIFKKIKMRMTH